VSQATHRSIVVGRITGIFGTKGWLRVFSYTDPPENILRYGPWSLGDEAAEEYRVTEGSLHGRGIIAHLDGIDDREVARRLMGASIRVSRAQFREAAADEYYWSDLIGLRVVGLDGMDLGEVESLMQTGANDVLVLRGARRRLLPFVTGSVVRSVDLEGRRIVVDWDPDF
jgi:16S rRNA processing protein RimM